jgi:hypothetical protein
VPANNIDDDYARWLATAPTEGVLIQLLRFTWPTDNLFFCANHIDSPTLFILENDNRPVALPYDFDITYPEHSGTTEQVVRLTGANSGGLFNLFESLQGNQINFNIMMQVRHYLSPSMLHKPMSSQPETYFVLNITYTATALSLDAGSQRLPRKQAGIPYTIEEYPGLL